MVKEKSKEIAPPSVEAFEQARNEIQGAKEAYGILQGIFQKPIHVYTSFEQAGIAFEVLLGNGEKAKRIAADLKKFEAISTE